MCVADQSQKCGCLVTSGHCRPSAADEEWHSLKRLSSTVVIQQSVTSYAEISNHLPYLSFLLDGNYAACSLTQLWAC